jgi:hypothetical protein
VKNLSKDEIKKHVLSLRDNSGAKVSKLKKTTWTSKPSQQGNWHIFLNQ